MKPQLKMSGIFAALPTPFRPDEERVDVDALRELIRFNLKSGVHVVLVCGGTGEFPNLTTEERKLVFRTTADEVKGSTTVLATTGYPDTKRTIEMTKVCTREGASSVGTGSAILGTTS